MSRVFFLILSFSFLFATGNIEIANREPNAKSQFTGAVRRTAMRLEGAARKRPLRLKFMNNSLAKTAMAALGMVRGGEPDVILTLLKEARAEFDGNNFAILLEAILRDSRGEQEAANRLFEQYLMKSRSFSDFDRCFMNWHDYQILRRGAYSILKSRGVSFEGRERDIQITGLMKYIIHSGGLDRTVNIIFIAVLLGGGVLVGLAALMQTDFSAFFPGLCLWSYILAWIAYGLWMLDLVRGLPFGLTRFEVIPIFVSGGVVLYLGAGLVKFWQEWTRPLEAGYRRCPHCREPVPKLVLECPVCHKAIEK